MADELKGISAMLACPTYGPVDPFCQKMLRVAMMSAGNRGLRWAGDVSADKQDFSTARNMAAQTLFDFPDSADGIVWVDSDIVLEQDSIIKLVGTAKRNNIDFLCGVYYKKGEPYDPVVYWYDPELDVYLGIENFALDMVVPISACGFGFVWTSTKTIQAIADNKAYFDEHGKWFPDTRHLPKGSRTPDGRHPFGEDFNFCDKARMAGIQLHMDTGLQLGHKGDGTVFDRAKYLQWLADNGGHLKPLDKERWRG